MGVPKSVLYLTSSGDVGGVSWVTIFKHDGPCSEFIFSVPEDEIGDSGAELVDRADIGLLEIADGAGSSEGDIFRLILVPSIEC
jgi:hypothetical protein